VILDEPMTGLDPDGRHEVREIIRETARSGTAVFFSSHLLPDAEELCERLVILKQGDVIYEGKTVDLIGKVARGYQVTCLRDGAESSETVANVSDLQAVIDRARVQGLQITEVKPLKLTLEQAFVEMALGGGR
jgi:ABC-2 type transport system ATP-binding protein